MITLNDKDVSEIKAILFKVETLNKPTRNSIYNKTRLIRLILKKNEQKMKKKMNKT